jgi:hypothetical protein
MHPSYGPSLIEVLKSMASEWRSKYEQAAELRDPDADDGRATILMDEHWDHPIWDLFRLIEEFTGITRETLERVAWRMNSQLGLAPLKRQRPGIRPDLPDLRWVFGELNKCDVNGTTETILRLFENKHPGTLAIFRFFDQCLGTGQVTRQQAAENANAGEPRAETRDGGDQQLAVRDPTRGAPKPSEPNLKSLLAAVADDNAIAIINVAQDAAKTADERMRMIYAIDNRALGWKSAKWADVLEVSDAAIRQTHWWKIERKRLTE